jgi:uncharacterized protein
MKRYDCGTFRYSWIQPARAVLLILLVLLLGRSTLAAEDAAKTSHMVAMRDGVRLATDVYLPPGVAEPVPAILIRTPYGIKDAGKALGLMAGLKGYALVAQDMRGRGGSEGNDAVVFHNDGWGERRDGRDTLEWIAGQKWCNGKIGTWGGSALGITQNMLAPDAPETLKAQHVLVAFSDMYRQCVFQGGAFRRELMEKWLQDNHFDPNNLKTFLAHPKYDGFWAELNSEAEAVKVNAPAIFIGGWYDIFAQGAINSFVAIQEHGGPGARGKCRLVMGPWAHGKLEGLEYPANAAKFPKASDAFRFYDHHLKGKANGVPEDKPVHYYVMGDPTDAKAPGNVWREADAWPPASTATPAYFHADGGLRFEPPKEADARREYQFDPDKPVPTVGGQNLFLPKGPMDQRGVESRPDVLVFTSEPLAEPIEVTGRLLAKLYVSSDQPDTDFTVKLCDVYPDGRSMLVTDGILRARYRESFEREDFLEPGKVYELTVDLWSTSLVFNRGHKIRVAVSSSNAPRFAPNPNTGGPTDPPGEKRIATNTLHLSQEHSSCLVLPVCKAAGTGG